MVVRKTQLMALVQIEAALAMLSAVEVGQLQTMLAAEVADADAEAAARLATASRCHLARARTASINALATSSRNSGSIAPVSPVGQ